MATIANKKEAATEKVFFLKGGASHGYGYAPGEFGLVRKSDLNDEEYTDKNGGKHKKKGLRSLGIVRDATDAEYKEFTASVEAELAARNPGPASSAARSAASPAAPASSPEILSALAEFSQAIERLNGRIDALETKLASQEPAGEDPAKK